MIAAATTHRFENRRDAGRQLAKRLAGLVKGERALVVAVQDDGIPVGYELARALHAPLESLRREAQPLPDLSARTVILVDDGLATEATILAAVKTIRQGGADRIIVAAPVRTPDVYAIVRLVADECACVVSHFPIHELSEWYDDFAQPSASEVQTLLAANRRWISRSSDRGARPHATIY